jgi:Flp pilus assembly protein TadG
VIAAAASRRDGERGAVLVEFVIAAVPLLMMFFCFTQVAALANAKLVVRHAAIAATRAAIVIMPPNPGNNGTMDDVRVAAGVAMGTYLLDGKLVAPDTQCTSQASAADPYGLVTCTVTATYVCDVPMGKWWVCGGSSKMVSDTMSLPNQGARYQ